MKAVNQWNHPLQFLDKRYPNRAQVSPSLTLVWKNDGRIHPLGWAGIQPPRSSPPPQHFRPRLRGVFFPRDKSGPACHMSTIHRKAFSDFDSARAADGHTRPSQRSGNPRRASRRISCGRSSLPRRNRKIVTSSLSSRRANHSIEVAARDNSPRSLWIREKWEEERA